MLLFIYTFSNDPVIRIAKERISDAVFLSLQEILQEATIHDVITPDLTRISWKFPNGLTIHNDPEVFLINRTFYCDKALFQDFAPEDREYAQQEFYSYLMFALNAFPHISETCGYASLCSGVYPLPTQWRKVQNLLPEMQIPLYYLGHPALLPKELEGSNTVFSTPYDYYYWKAGAIPQTSSIFAFEKPKGEPVISLNIDQETSLHPMFNDQKLHLPESQIDEIKTISLQIHRLFGYFFSEILFFVEEQKINFGMANNYLLASQRVQGFDDLVFKGFDKYLGKEKNRQKFYSSCP